MKPKIAARKRSTGKFRAKLRMVKRGWTQPDSKMRQQIIAGMQRKLAKSVTSATIDEFRGASRERGLEGLMDAMRMAIKKHKAEIILHTTRTATKYALDAVGITDRATRAELHVLTKDLAETVIYSGYDDVFANKHAKDIVMAALKKIGIVKTVLFCEKFSLFPNK